MRILYDSREEQYKSPFGTLTVEQNCTLHVRIPKEIETKFVQLVLEKADADAALEFPFSWADSEGDYDVFRCEFSIDARGLYFYWFRITARSGTFRLFRQGRDTNMEAGERWQITCFAEDYAVPRGFCGRMMYQIFPDRFAVGGKVITEGKMKPFRVHRSASEPPDPQPDPDGTWNADFFGGNFRGIIEKLD